jgi:hypothetical protein
MKSGQKRKQGNKTSARTVIARIAETSPDIESDLYGWLVLHRQPQNVDSLVGAISSSEDQAFFSGGVEALRKLRSFSTTRAFKRRIRQLSSEQVAVIISLLGARRDMRLAQLYRSIAISKQYHVKTRCVAFENLCAMLYLRKKTKALRAAITLGLTQEAQIRYSVACFFTGVTETALVEKIVPMIKDDVRLVRYITETDRAYGLTVAQQLGL